MKRPYLLLVNTTDPNHPGDGVLIDQPVPESARSCSFQEYIFDERDRLGLQQPGVYRVSAHIISGNINRCSMTKIFEVVVPTDQTIITEIT